MLIFGLVLTGCEIGKKDTVAGSPYSDATFGYGTFGHETKTVVSVSGGTSFSFGNW